MILLHPWSLWGLLTVPVVLTALLWRARHRRQSVPSLLLWERLAEHGPAGTPSRRWLADPAVLAAAAFLLLSIFALARPTLRSPSPAPQKLLLLIDLTASMSTRQPDGTTRLELAAKRCEELLNELSGQAQIALLTAPQEPSHALDFALSRTQAVAAVRKLQPTDAPGDLVSALGQALAALPPDEDASIVVLTDQELSPLPERPGRAICMVTVGSPSGNVGIIGFHVSASDGAIFATLRNCSQNERQVAVAAKLNDLTLPPQQVTLAAGERRGVIFRHSLDQARTLELHLEPPDELVADDAAWAARAAKATFEVAYCGEPDLSIRRALEAAGAEVTAVSAGSDTRGFPLAIYNRVAQPPRFSSPHVVVIAPPEDLGKILVRGELKEPKPVVVAPGHALMQHVAMDDVTISSAALLRPPDTHTKLVESDGRPLILFSGDPARSLLVLAFQPARSNWPLKASFPIFWLNVLQYAGAGRQAGKEFTFLRTGQSALVRASEGQPLKLRGPRGSLELTASDAGLAAFLPLHAGLYERQDASHERLAANLLSASESDNTGSSSAFDAKSLAHEINSGVPSGYSERELTPWLALAAMAALALFWVFRS